MIRALVFDFDGLILDTESALIDAYAAVHARYGLPFDRALFQASVGHADYTFDPWHAFEKRADRAALEVERQQRNRELNDRLSTLPGAAALLDAGRDAGLRLGVASNSRHPHVEGQLRRIGLHDRFEFFACREDAPSPKPEPDLYRLVLQPLRPAGPRGHRLRGLPDGDHRRHPGGAARRGRAGPGHRASRFLPGGPAGGFAGRAEPGGTPGALDDAGSRRPAPLASGPATESARAEGEWAARAGSAVR